jgi:hypothetical protein
MTVSVSITTVCAELDEVDTVCKGMTVSVSTTTVTDFDEVSPLLSLIPEAVEKTANEGEAAVPVCDTYVVEFQPPEPCA